MCSDVPIYLFSDVRNGVPANGNCKHEIIVAVNRHASIYAILLLSVGLVGFIGLAMSFSICLFQRKAYQGREFYNPSKWGSAAKND